MGDENSTRRYTEDKTSSLSHWAVQILECWRNWAFLFRKCYRSRLKKSINLLRTKLNNRVISWRDDMNWPTRSCILHHWIFLEGAFKDISTFLPILKQLFTWSRTFASKLPKLYRKKWLKCFNIHVPGWPIAQTAAANFLMK